MEQRAAKLRGETIHGDHVIRPATAPPRLPATADLRESRAAIGPDRPLVVSVHREHDVMQAKEREAVVEHEDRGLGPVALAPAVLLANDDTEAGRAVEMIDLVQRGLADGPHGG